MKEKFKLVFTPKDKDKLNEKALEIERKDPRSTIVSIYSLLGDSLKENARVYKLKRPIESTNKKIPKFIFL